jgi:signal transduction histidine kinase
LKAASIRIDRMRITDTFRTKQTPYSLLLGYVPKRLRVEADPPDAAYRERYAEEMSEGFRTLSLLTFVSMSILLVAHLVRPSGLTNQIYEGPSLVGCALLSVASGLALLASKSVRSADHAFRATTVLLVSAVAVISIDRLQRTAPVGRSIGTLLPLLLSILVLSAALLPMRPSRMFALGVVLLGTSWLAASFLDVPLRMDPAELAGAGTVLAVSVVTAAKSTSQRIRIHHAHASALASERVAEASRERALLAESAVTMERLAASVSHEINTPIGVLKSSTETLRRCVRKFVNSADGGCKAAPIIEELFEAVADSTTRLTEIVARIQRFANLDRSALRLVDVNQLVQDAVALMNPPSANQTRVRLRLQPLPAIWCRPHALSAAVACVLNKLLEVAHPITIETRLEEEGIVLRIEQISAALKLVSGTDLGFSVVEGRVRAAGWDLFAARQLVHQSSGRLRVEFGEEGARVVIISVPREADLTMASHNSLG